MATTYAAGPRCVNHTAGDVFQTIGRQQGTDLIFDQAGFFAAHSETQNRLLSAGLCWISGNAYRPRFEALQRALSEVQDGKTSSLHGCLIYAHQNTLRITREYAATQDSADQTVGMGGGRASICQRSTTSKHWGNMGPHNWKVICAKMFLSFVTCAACRVFG